MTHDPQGSTPATAPQETPSTDPTTRTISLEKPSAAPQAPADAAPAPADEAPAGTTPDPYGTPGDAGYGLPAGQPGYGQPTPPSTGTDGLSIAALVTGILALGLIPLVLGILGLRRTKARGTSGRGLAIAGIVLGALSTLGWIIAIISVVVAGTVVMRTVDEAGGLEELTEQLQTTAPEVVETESTDTAVPDSATPLKDIVPLAVGGFTTAGLTDEPQLTGAGALEAYRATYTDGVSNVETVVVDWATTGDSLAHATAETAAYTPESLVETAELATDTQYWLYDVAGTATLVAVNGTASLTFVGPIDAVIAIYDEYPL